MEEGECNYAYDRSFCYEGAGFKPVTRTNPLNFKDTRIISLFPAGVWLTYVPKVQVGPHPERLDGRPLVFVVVVFLFFYGPLTRFVVHCHHRYFTGTKNRSSWRVTGFRERRGGNKKICIINNNNNCNDMFLP